MTSGVVRMVLALVVCLSVLSGRVKAATATFDDLNIAPQELTLKTLTTYKGLQWRGIEVINGAHEFFNTFAGCGYRTGIVSGRHVAIAANRFEKGAEIASPPGRRFDFHGVYLTAGWLNDLTVHVEGLRSGRRLYTKTVVVNTTRPTRLMVEFHGIDTLRIRSSGGTDAGICEGRGCRPGPEIAMDNFSFSLRAAAAARVTAAPPTRQTLLPRLPKALVEKPRPAVPPPGHAEASQRDGCPDYAYHGIQVGAFSSLDNAKKLRDRLVTQFGAAQMYVNAQGGRPIYRVVVGCMNQPEAARELLSKMQQGGVQGFVVWVMPDALGKRL